MQIITVHGLAFGIDTNDWANSQDAAKGATHLEGWVKSLSADDAARIHAALSDEDADTPPEEVSAAESAAWSVATEDYGVKPQTGHNMALVAR